MSKASVRITFVRHGESESNRVQRWQGQGNSALSELGRMQASALGERIRGRAFQRVIASDLDRAVSTARATGFGFDTDPMWREFDVGAWEGLTREEVVERFPAEMERLKNGEDIPLGGGESHAVFAARIDGALTRLKSQLSPGDHALVVCHGGVISTVIAGVLGLRGRGRWPLSRVSNTSISELSFDQAGATMHVFNDTLHLSSVGDWPNYLDTSSCIGLIAESTPHHSYGPFEAHYDADESFVELVRDSDPAEAAENLTVVLSHLGARHPAQRVSLSTRASLIRAWAEDTLWLGAARTGNIVDPAMGSVSHVGNVAGRPALLDYGVRYG